MIILCISFFFFLVLVNCIQCYACTSNEPNCATPNTNTKYFLCSKDQVCYIETRFFRANTSVSYVRNPDFMERKCQKPAQNMCKINDAKYGPCITNKDSKMLSCYSCCESDFCNTYTPLFNKADTPMKSITLLVLPAMVSVYMYLC